MATRTHRIRLNFVSLCLTNVQFETILKSTELVYSQYGIGVEFSSGVSLGLPPDKAKKYEKVDGACKWKITSGELSEIQNLGGPFPFLEIGVFYVDRFTSGLLGCGGHADGEPACIVAANASKWDTAHEIGHVLLGSAFRPVHSTDVKNLMHESASTYAKTPILTPTQVTQIKKHPSCMAA